jgi:hypothetical protein
VRAGASLGEVVGRGVEAAVAGALAGVAGRGVEPVLGGALAREAGTLPGASGDGGALAAVVGRGVEPEDGGVLDVPAPGVEVVGEVAARGRGVEAVVDGAPGAAAGRGVGAVVDGAPGAALGRVSAPGGVAGAASGRGVEAVVDGVPVAALDGVSAAASRCTVKAGALAGAAVWGVAALLGGALAGVAVWGVAALLGGALAGVAVCGGAALLGGALAGVAVWGVAALLGGALAGVASRGGAALLGGALAGVASRGVAALLGGALAGVAARGGAALLGGALAGVAGRGFAGVALAAVAGCGVAALPGGVTGCGVEGASVVGAGLGGVAGLVAWVGLGAGVASAGGLRESRCDLAAPVSPGREAAPSTMRAARMGVARSPACVGSAGAGGDSFAVASPAASARAFSCMRATHASASSMPYVGASWAGLSCTGSGAATGSGRVQTSGAGAGAGAGSGGRAAGARRVASVSSFGARASATDCPSRTCEADRAVRRSTRRMMVRTGRSGSGVFDVLWSSTRSGLLRKRRGQPFSLRQEAAPVAVLQAEDHVERPVDVEGEPGRLREQLLGRRPGHFPNRPSSTSVMSTSNSCAHAGQFTTPTASPSLLMRS